MLLQQDAGAQDEVMSEDYKYEKEYLVQQRDDFIRQNSDLVIKNITVSGISKTRLETVINEVHAVPGQKLSAFNCYHTVNSLKRKNIFSSIDLYYIPSGNGVDIQVVVKEKWTIIPIPLFTSNGNKLSIGFYILETNFFGFGKTIFSGGSISTAGNSAIIGYVDPAVNYTDFRMNVFLSFKQLVFETGDMYKEEFNRYRATSTLARLDLGYTFNGHFNLYMSGGYRDSMTDKDYSRSYNKPESARMLPFGVLLYVDRLSYYEYLYFGLKFDPAVYYGIDPENGKSYGWCQYSGQYSMKLFSCHRLAFFSSGAYGVRPESMGDRISGKTGAMTLPADIISADNWINGSLVYEYPLLRFRWGSVTVLSFWEQGVFESRQVNTTYYFGPGCGTLLYLKRIAIPAMGFNLGYNVRTTAVEFSFYVGMAI